MCDGRTDRQTDGQTDGQTSHIVHRAALELAANNKAFGCDGIPGELLKYGGAAMEGMMEKLRRKIWRKEKIPVEWEEMTPASTEGGPSSLSQSSLALTPKCWMQGTGKCTVCQVISSL